MTVSARAVARQGAQRAAKNGTTSAETITKGPWVSPTLTEVKMAPSQPPVDASGVAPVLIVINLGDDAREGERFAGWWARMDADPSADDIIELGGKDTRPGHSFIDVLARLVVDWNFRAKRDGSLAPPDTDGVKSVPVRSLIALGRLYAANYMGSLPNAPETA